MESTVTKPGRLIVARFDEGEDLLNSLKKCAEDNGIKSAYFGLIGGLKELSYGLYEKGAHRNVRKTPKDCFELLPTFGNVTMKQGDIIVHAHIMVAAEGELYGGHLMEGSKIYPFAEVFMQETEVLLERKYDDKLKLWAIKP
ncbi:MAG: DUF296 domain-containing protein [Pseudomonadota bacterium]